MLRYNIIIKIYSKYKPYVVKIRERGYAMTKIDVSVIVLTYKPVWKKLKITLDSVLRQKDVRCEIVITDDGSEMDCREMIENYLKEKGFTDYIYNKNEYNVGTIKNYISGLKQANGRYVYGISPGDMLYGEDCLKQLADFCTNNHVEICFGNALYYNGDGENVKVFSDENHPRCPSFYKKDKSYFVMKNMFFNDENILGASYFRDRKIAIECFEGISKNSLYLEDKCGTAVAIARKMRIVHFDRNVIWYEKGTGVSTSGNTAWQERLRKDYCETICELKKQYPKDRVIDAVYIRYNCENKLKRKMLLVIKHPVFIIMDIIRRMIKVRYTEATDMLQEELEQSMDIAR